MTLEGNGTETRFVGWLEGNQWWSTARNRAEPVLRVTVNTEHTPDWPDLWKLLAEKFAGQNIAVRLEVVAPDVEEDEELDEVLDG
jgi:hypothetical protein